MAREVGEGGVSRGYTCVHVCVHVGTHMDVCVHTHTYRQGQ